MNRRYSPRQFIVSVAFLLLIFASACILANDHQRDPRGEILVSVDWLAQHLGDPDLVLLHVGNRDGYVAEHIPGAHYVTRDQVSRPRSDNQDALTLELPNPEDLARLLESFGISNDSRIVLYWGGEWVSQTTRVLFTLDWAGLGNQTALLDGGIEAWIDARLPTTDEIPDATSGNVTLTPRPELVVDGAWVAEHATQPGFALVDARSPQYFSGELEDRTKTGHIPNAGNAHWMGMVDDSVKLKSAEDLAQIFTTAGVENGDTLIAYCHIGQYATVVLFAARTLGHEVRLYDGSFEDWAARDLPAVTGASRRGVMQ